MDINLPTQSTPLNTTCMECGEECSTWESYLYREF